VIGHSRGGDLALAATGLLNHEIDTLITLATPKYDELDDLHIDLSKIGNWLNVTTSQDWVQPAASFVLVNPHNAKVSTYGGAYNLRLRANGYGPRTAHTRFGPTRS